MSVQTGSTYIFESMTDIIKIPTANLRFSTMTSSKKVFLRDSNNDRQPEMTAETGNTYISLKVWDIKIPTANLGLWTTSRSKILSSADCDHDLSLTTENGNTDVLGASLAILGCPSSQSLGYTFIELLVVVNPRFAFGILKVSLILSEI